MKRIGRYEIVRPLGRGAMGVVYLARDPQIERELALKTIRFDSGEKGMDVSEAKARFLKEARISGRLQHPFIVTIFDVGEDAGNLYLAMEYVPGGSFSQKLADPNGLPLFDRIRIVAEVAEALGHAHERGVLHRDVKPANILLTPALTAKVTDFGIGKLLTGDTDLTSTGQMVGSPAYMSPEQIRGEKLDARTDIFSLGVVLYQALTLRKPFPADTLTTLVYQILHEEPPAPGIIKSDLPAEMTGIVRKCLAKARADRYGDAGEVAAELRALLGYSPVASTAGLSESKVKRAQPEAPPTVAGPTVAMPPPVPPRESESPTITTGQRMGDLAKKSEAPAKGGPGAAKASPYLALAAVLGLAIVAAAAFLFRSPPKSGEGGTASAPAPKASTQGPAPLASTASTGSIKVVETPVATSPASGEPSPVPTRRPRVRPTAVAGSAVAASGASSGPAPAPTARPADLSYAVKRLVKINVSPSQARVFLDGKCIGISDDWDGAGGGALLSFTVEGNHRLRFAYPGYRDLNVDLAVKSGAVEDRIEIDTEMQKGAPEGPTGPEGKLRRPNYRTVRPVNLNVEPADATVSVNGRELGPASKWAKEDLIFADQAVYDVVLSAPGHEPLTVRVLSAPTAGEVRAVIKEKLKKAK